MVAHTLRGVNHTECMKLHGIKNNCVVPMWNYVELHNKTYIYVIENVVA